MSTELVDVRAPILDSPGFGPDEIATVQNALAKRQTSDVKQALHDLRMKTSQGGSDRDLLAQGIVMYLLAMHDEAIETLEQLNKSAIAQYYLGLAALGIGAISRAAEAFVGAANAGYDKVQASLMQAGCLRQLGKADEAEQLIRSVAREGATRAEYSYQMGCILSDRGDTYGALEYFERAVDMDNNHSRALFNLANLNNKLGNDDEAIRLYEQMLAKPPIYMGALINLGLLYEDREQYNAAAFCFKRVVDAQPDNERARLYLKDIESSSQMYFDEEAARRDKLLEQTLQIPISDFELSARCRNCLDKAGIGSLKDLTEVTEEQLLASKNFGETSLKEIKAILDLHGLRLGQNVTTQKHQPIYRPEELTPEERALHEALVSDLDLSVRARKCLARLGIATVGELVSRSAEELLSVRNFGVTSLNEIREKLRERGIGLRGD